jgi:hypothetical protein
MKGHYRPYREEDIAIIAPKMCEADATEIMLSDGLEPLEALQRACRESHEANTIVAPSGELLGMFGLSFMDEFMGSPWMLTTGKLDKYYIQFLRGSRDWVVEANNKRNILVNYVHVENKLAINWLRFLGFSFLRELEYGVGKAPFYEFVRIK